MSDNKGQSSPNFMTIDSWFASTSLHLLKMQQQERRCTKAVHNRYTLLQPNEGSTERKKGSSIFSYTSAVKISLTGEWGWTGKLRKVTIRKGDMAHLKWGWVLGCLGASASWPCCLKTPKKSTSTRFHASTQQPKRSEDRLSIQNPSQR